jgi:hypothetical protein
VRAGFAVENVENVFCGQYMWLTGRAAAPGAAVPSGAAEVRALAREFSRRRVEREAAWSRKIEERRRQGPVALWGAGAKGVTFANLLDAARASIDCLADINPRKQGRFVSGSAHPIVAPEDLPGRGGRSVILLNPNYAGKVAARLAQIDPRIERVDQP